MKTLIAEDDFTSRLLLQSILAPYGETNVAINGKEAIQAFNISLSKNSYDLVCLDIMMPELNGQEVLSEIRRIESEKGVMPGDGVKIIMTTALKDHQNVTRAFKEQCDAYLIKPIDKSKLISHLVKLGLIY